MKTTQVKNGAAGWKMKQYKRQKYGVTAPPLQPQNNKELK